MRYPLTARSTLLLAALLASLGQVAAAAAEGQEPGEFSIPSAVPLTAAERDRLRALVESDPDAAAWVRRVRDAAEPLLDAQPRPLETIHYAGLVNTDPKRIASVQRLRDMADAATVLRYWQLTGDDRAAAMLRRYVTAWAQAYEVTGNDVNENKLVPLLIAYEALRPTFDEPDRAAVDAWVAELGRRHAAAIGTRELITNRFAKHVRLATAAGRVLGRDDWLDAAGQGIRKYISQGLHADGTSEDLRRRDSLDYHGSGLKTVLELAILLGDDGTLYRWESPRGGSLSKSVDYVVPYAMGEKRHAEWVHTKVQLDRDRAKAGIEKYRPGKLYDPADALDLMVLGSYFDPGLDRVVAHLRGEGAAAYPTWRALMNAVLSPPPGPATAPAR